MAYFNKYWVENQSDTEKARIARSLCHHKPYIVKSRNYNMMGITALGLFALSLPVFASTDTQDASFQSGWVGVLLTLLMVRLREPQKKEIGGWLIYYYIRLYYCDNGFVAIGQSNPKQTPQA